MEGGRTSTPTVVQIHLTVYLFMSRRFPPPPFSECPGFSLILFTPQYNGGFLGLLWLYFPQSIVPQSCLHKVNNWNHELKGCWFQSRWKRSIIKEAFHFWEQALGTFSSDACNYCPFFPDWACHYYAVHESASI